MLVANNSFDLWQKDTFFSAAEEVQASADIMESAYRTWVRKRNGDLSPLDLDYLSRELQTALGTAKWQLDEFERAVRLSYGNRTDDITSSRHIQFVTAIESQISRVEAALREYVDGEGTKPLRWVNLDEKECDDLAMFLSGTTASSKCVKRELIETKSPLSDKKFVHNDWEKTAKGYVENRFSNQTKACNDVTVNEDHSYIIEIEPNEISGTSDGSSSQADKKGSTRRVWTSPDYRALKVKIHHEDEDEKPLAIDIMPSPKDKGAKLSPWKAWSENNNRAKGGFLCHNQLKVNNWIGQVLRRTFGNQRHLESSIHLQRSRYFRLVLLLMLSIFIIGKLFIRPGSIL